MDTVVVSFNLSPATPWDVCDTPLFILFALISTNMYELTES